MESASNNSTPEKESEGIGTDAKLRVFFCGASSSGKTTLLRALSSLSPTLNLHCITEVARSVLTTNNITFENLKSSFEGDRKLFLEIQTDILREQYAREEEMEVKGVAYVSDRGPDPIVYLKYYAQTSEDMRVFDDMKKSEIWQRMEQRYRNSLVVLVYPLPYPTEDGVRLIDDNVEAFTDCFRNVLQDCKIPILELRTADHDERMRIVEEEIQVKFKVKMGTVTSSE